MLPEWLKIRQQHAKKRYALHDTPKLRYGLTIRLQTKNLQLRGREEEHSEQLITLEHENCDVANLFDELDNPIVEKNLLQLPPAQETVFTNFTEAFFDIGLLIIVPDNAQAKVNLTRTITSNTFKEHILILAGKNSTLTITDKHTSNECTLKASTVEIVAQEHAHVRYATIQALKEECIDVSSYRAQAKDNAKVDWFLASIGSLLTHANADTYLEGINSTARSYGVFLGKQAQQFDVSASTFHRGNKSISDMYTRGVLLDKAKAVYRGNIDIHKDAYDCNGYQKEETLLIGSDAVADAIPNLEIRNNQVKCSHGASIGRIDEEQLFYLASRGIAQQEATNMIIKGFFEPVTEKLEWTELFELLRPLVEEKLA